MATPHQSSCLENPMDREAWQTTAHGVANSQTQLSARTRTLTYTQSSMKSQQNFFLIFFIYFYQLEANYFTILWWFLSYIDMNQPWIYMCSPSRCPLPPPSPPDPSGSSQCTRPEYLSHASNLGW